MQISNNFPIAKISSQDYLLVITPNEEVISSVVAFKDKAKELVGPYPSFNSKAHITVNHYYNTRSLFFDDRVPVYRSMVSRVESLKIKISGFDFFEHKNSCTIYAKVELNTDVKSTFFRFRKIFGSDVPEVPHITIARNLSPKQFQILWAYFKSVKYESTFYATKIDVLKTPTRRFFNERMSLETELELKYLN